MLAVVTPPLLVAAEAELGVADPRNLRDLPRPLPTGVLLRDVDPGLEYAGGPGLRVLKQGSIFCHKCGY